MIMEKPDYMHREENNVHSTEIPAIPDISDVKVDCIDDNKSDLEIPMKKEEEDGTVTLRRQNISLSNLSAFTEDDYLFSDDNQDSHFRSRKKTEIGSEKMISNDVSINLFGSAFNNNNNKQKHCSHLV